MLDAGDDAAEIIRLVAGQKIVGDVVSGVQSIADVIAVGRHGLVAQERPAPDAAVAIGDFRRTIDGVGELPGAADPAAVVEVHIAGARQRRLAEDIDGGRVAEDACELQGAVGSGSVGVVVRVVDVELLDAGRDQQVLCQLVGKVGAGLVLGHVAATLQPVAIEVQRDALGQFQIALEAVLVPVLRHLLVEGRESRLLVGIAGFQVALGAGNDVSGVEAAQHPVSRGGVAIFADDAGIRDSEAAIDRLREAKARPLRDRDFAFEEGLVGFVELHIGAAQLLVGAPRLLERAGDAEADMVTQPLLGAAAIDIAIDLARRGHELIGCDEILVVAAQRPVTHQVAGIDGGGKRLVEQDDALHIVDGIVTAIDKRLAIHHAARHWVPHLDIERFRARGDVLVGEEIGRAARAAEHVALRQRAGLGGIAMHLAGTLARGHHLVGLQHHVGAIECAIIAQELGAADVGLEIAPYHPAVAALHPHIELAAGRRILDCHRVVAIDRVVVLRVDALEEALRVLVVETLEHVLDTSVARIRRGGQEP